MPKAQTITSAANPLLKEVRRAIARGGLTENGSWVAETFHLLEEALRSDCRIATVLASESAHPQAESLLRRLPHLKILVLPDPLLQQLSGTETTQGVITLVDPPSWTIDRMFPAQPLLVILDGLQDPGNAGTIVRTAEAFGATGVLFLKGSVSPFNPKTLRASAGSLFRIPFLAAVDPSLAASSGRDKGVQLYAGVPARPSAPAKALHQVDLTAPCALVIGSEAHGIREELRAVAAGISIPTVGVESLNAAVAAGILLYEARRQRTRRP